MIDMGKCLKRKPSLLVTFLVIGCLGAVFVFRLPSEPSLEGFSENVFSQSLGKLISTSEYKETEINSI